MLIRPQEVRAEQITIFLGYKHLVLWRHPEGKSISAAHVHLQCVSFTRSNYRFQNGPDRVAVIGRGAADLHGG